MSSSGAAMNGLTVPARSTPGEEHARRGLPAIGSLLRTRPEGPERQGAQKVRVLKKSVDGLSDRLDICRPVCAQPIVVTLKMFDNGLQIANPRPESSALQDKTIVPVRSLTQQRLGHTNSVEILRTCGGRWTTH